MSPLLWHTSFVILQYIKYKTFMCGERGREGGWCVCGGGGGGQIKSSVVSRGYGSLHFHFVL